MFKHLCLKEACFIELDFQREDWLIQNSGMHFNIYEYDKVKVIYNKNVRKIIE